MTESSNNQEIILNPGRNVWKGFGTLEIAELLNNTSEHAMLKLVISPEVTTALYCYY
jgi:hypothetical protein